MSQNYPETPGPYPAPPAADVQPVRVQLPQGTPVVTYSILAVTILVFLGQLASLSYFGYDLPASLGAKYNQGILEGQLWRLFTPMLLHSTSLMLHIVFNMYALYSFGPGLERFNGHLRFLTLYLLAAYTGNVLSFVFSPAPSLGASTAIFGLVGAEAVFLYQNRSVLGRRAQSALGNLVLIVVLNLFLGFSSGFVDNWGHIGGLIGGAAFAWFGGPLLKVSGIFPDLRLVNQREPRRSYTVALVVFLLFSGLALIGMLLA